MNRFVVACAFLACAYGAPMPEADATHLLGAGALGYTGAGVVGAGALGYAGAGLVGAPVASAPAVVGQTSHAYAAGPPVVENRVEYGVVGQRTVQTGVQQVVAGHAYAVAGHETIPQPATSYVAGAPQHLMLPSPLPLSQLDLLPLTLLSSRESLPQSEPTPESPPRSPTLSHKSMSRNTTLMSQ